MAVTIRRLSRKAPRKPGQRANITTARIVDVATEVLDNLGLEDFSGRAVAKELGVTPAAVYAQIGGGMAELRSRIVYAVLSAVSRPFQPDDTPASYIEDIFLRLLRATRAKQPLAQLLALELSKDVLVYPMFAERILALTMTKEREPFARTEFLELVLAMMLGMVLVEGETNRQDISAGISRELKRRIKTFPPDQAPALLANSDELMLRIRRRLARPDAAMRKTSNRYAAPIVAALQAMGLGQGVLN